MLSPDECWGAFFVRSFVEIIQHRLICLGAVNFAKLRGRKQCFGGRPLDFSHATLIRGGIWEGGCI